MSGSIESNQIASFLIRIAEDPRYRTRYEENPIEILDEAGIPEEKKAEIMSGNLGKVLDVVGIGSLNFTLVHTDI